MELLSKLDQPLTTTIFGVIIALCVIVFYSLKQSKRYPPIVGTVFNLAANLHRVHDFTTHHAKKHPTFRINAFSRYMIFTADPTNVEYILKSNFSNYGKGKLVHEHASDLLGDGIFTVDGAQWRHQRKLASFEFSSRNIRDFSTVVFKNNVVKLASMIFKSAALNKTYDYQDLFMKSTLDSVFKVVLGVELDTMSGTYDEGTKFSKAFDEASEITFSRGLDVFYRIKKFLNIGSEAVLRKNIKLVDKYVYKIINSKIEQVNKLSNDKSTDGMMKKGDILSRFLQENERDPKYLKDIILSFIIAGKDTTATTLSWFLYMLCKHPHVQERISTEVREAANVSDKSTFQDLANGITEEALDKLQYLHAALTETIRLYPAVPWDPKCCFSDDTLPDGFNIKKGEQIFYMPYAMGRMKYIWGDDAEEFKPQRWLDENGKFQTQSSFKFTGFQAGPRICLGKEFAYRQMKIFSAVLVGSFKFKLSNEQKVVTYKPMLTLSIDGGLHLHASPRHIH
jgi:cytochrome P450